MALLLLVPAKEAFTGPIAMHVSSIELRRPGSYIPFSSSLTSFSLTVDLKSQV